MTVFKPKNTDETLKDIIGSALNDNSTFYEDEKGRCSDQYIPAENFDEVENDILKNLKESKYINIEFKEGEMINLSDIIPDTKQRKLLCEWLETDRYRYKGKSFEQYEEEIKGFKRLIREFLEDSKMLGLENKNLKEQVRRLAKVIKKGMRICNNLGIDLNELEGE